MDPARVESAARLEATVRSAGSDSPPRPPTSIQTTFLRSIATRPHSRRGRQWPAKGCSALTRQACLLVARSSETESELMSSRRRQRCRSFQAGGHQTTRRGWSFSNQLHSSPAPPLRSVQRVHRQNPRRRAADGSGPRTTGPWRPLPFKCAAMRK